MDKFKTTRNGTRVTFLTRVSFVHLDAPWAANEQNEKKYSLSCIIPKDDAETVTAIREAIHEAYDGGKAKNKWPDTVRLDGKQFRYPLKDGDTYEDANGKIMKDKDAAFGGCLYIGPSSKSPVYTCNRLKQKIAPTDIYSGCYCLVSVNFFAFDTGSKGIGAGLNAVMFWADGERLGGVGDGSNAFDAFDTAPVTDVNDLGL